MERFLLIHEQPIPRQYIEPTVPYAIMHKARLSIREFTPAEKLESALWLLEFGFTLPDGVRVVDGQLLGVEYDQ